MRKQHSLSLHLGGEEIFEFETPGGRHAVQRTAEALTPFGGVVPFAAFLRRLGVVEKLAASCPVRRTSPNASAISDILHSFMLTAIAEGRRFAHVERMREDPALAEVFGMKRIVGADTIRRFFASIDPDSGAQWLSQANERVWEMLPGRVILDWDSTVQTKYGHQEGACIGYNPTKPGRKSFHPLLAVASGTRLCMAYRFRSGDTVTASQWRDAMEQVMRTLPEGRTLWLNRGDLGLGHEPIMRWHEQQSGGPHYLFKLKQTKNVRRAIHAISEQAWQGPANGALWQVAETRVRLEGWSCERRLVLARRVQGRAPRSNQTELWKLARHEYAVYVTDLPVEQANGWQVHALYKERADAENVFDELKNQWGFNGFCSGKKAASAMAAGLLLLTYNLWSLLVRLMGSSRHIEAVKSRRWLLVIAGRLSESGRRKMVSLCAQGGWWEMIRSGYRRLAEWLASTAPQLDNAAPKPAADPIFPVPIPLSNCGF